VAGSIAPSPVQASLPIPGSSRRFALDITLTGAYQARITDATPEAGDRNGAGLLCQQANARVHTTLVEHVQGEPVTVDVIVGSTAPGQQRGVLVVMPP
jgi:hypothetical protein